MARPRKAPAEKRDEQLNARLTAAERAEIEQNAERLGITPADFVRRRALGYRLPETALAQQAQASLGTAFNRLAVNVNQIARHLNSGGDPSGIEAELQALIDRLNAELDKVYGPIGNAAGPQL